MSTPNFWTQADFPLFAHDLTTKDEAGNDCNMDWLETEDFCECIHADLDEINDNLLFHKIILKSGYYVGVQFYVEINHDPSGYDNDDCQYEFGWCRSVTLRRYAGEQTKINRALKKLARGYGFMELVCIGVFSNGEAIYERASNPRARLKAAANS